MIQRKRRLEWKVGAGVCKAEARKSRACKALTGKPGVYKAETEIPGVWKAETRNLASEWL